MDEALRANASNPMWNGRMKFVPVASYFIHSSTKNLMVVDPCKGTLVYKDAGHVNVDGARRVEPLFRKHVFDQAVCES